MKKVLKLVWMVLFALPLISLTACGDEEETIVDAGGEEVVFKDYSDLLGKTMTDILNDKMKDFNPTMFTNGEGIFYSALNNDLGMNVNYLAVYFAFTYVEDDEVYIVEGSKNEKAIWVTEDVSDFTLDALANHLTSKYGKLTILSDGTYEYTKGNMLVWLEESKEEGEEPVCTISYLNKSEYEKFFRNDNATRGGADLGASMRKAARIQRAGK